MGRLEIMKTEWRKMILKKDTENSGLEQRALCWRSQRWLHCKASVVVSKQKRLPDQPERAGVSQEPPPPLPSCPGGWPGMGRGEQQVSGDKLAHRVTSKKKNGACANQKIPISFQVLRKLGRGGWGVG